jgi:hypothetical protein
MEQKTERAHRIGERRERDKKFEKGESLCLHEEDLR